MSVRTRVQPHNWLIKNKTNPIKNIQYKIIDTHNLYRLNYTLRRNLIWKLEREIAVRFLRAKLDVITEALSNDWRESFLLYQLRRAGSNNRLGERLESNADR